jgi:hypothetical protein
MAQADRDARRAGGCSTSGTFTTLIRARVPGKQRTTPEMDERWLRVVLDGEVPPGGSLTGLFRAGDDPNALGPQEAAPAQGNAEYLEISGSLTSDGIDPVRVPPGGAALVFGVRMPTLLRADRTCLAGGSTVYGLRQAYDRPDYRTDPVGGHSRPVPVTERIGRLDGWQVTFSTHEAEAEFQRDMLDVEWTIESPFFDAVHRVRLYEVSPPEPMDTGLWDEVRTPYEGEATVFQIDRAEILETGTLR